MSNETGHAVLKIDKETGEKYWQVKKGSLNEYVDLGNDKAIMFLPEEFDEGAEIRVFEPRG